MAQGLCIPACTLPTAPPPGGALLHLPRPAPVMLISINTSGEGRDADGGRVPILLSKAAQPLLSLHTGQPCAPTQALTAPPSALPVRSQKVTLVCENLDVS